MIYVIDLDNGIYDDEVDEEEDGVQPFFSVGPFASHEQAEDWGNRNLSFFTVVRAWFDG